MNKSEYKYLYISVLYYNLEHANVKKNLDNVAQAK